MAWPLNTKLYIAYIYFTATYGTFQTNLLVQHTRNLEAEMYYNYSNKGMLYIHVEQ